MKLYQHWAKDFNICHSFIQQIFINTKCQESQRQEPCSKTPSSQVRQGLDTCYLTTVKIKSYESTVCVRAGRQTGGRRTEIWRKNRKKGGDWIPDVISFNPHNWRLSLLLSISTRRWTQNWTTLESMFFPPCHTVSSPNCFLWHLVEKCWLYFRIQMPELGSVLQAGSSAFHLPPPNSFTIKTSRFGMLMNLICSPRP